MAFPGGSFAPPLSDALLAAYEALATSASPEIKDAMQKLLQCVKHWWQLPDSSTARSVPHPSGRGMHVPLDKPIADALWDDIPWGHELNAIQALLNTIPEGQRDLRDAAFHLLWYVRELDLDREPITLDKVNLSQEEEAIRTKHFSARAGGPPITLQLPLVTPEPTKPAAMPATRTI